MGVQAQVIPTTKGDREGIQVRLPLPPSDAVLRQSKFAPDATKAYPELETMLTRNYYDMSLAVALVQAGFGPFPVDLMLSDGTRLQSYFPIASSDVGDMHHVRIDHPECTVAVSEKRFFSFAPSGDSGITEEFDPEHQVALSGFHPVEVERLRLLTETYLSHEYIGRDHLAPVRLLDGTIEMLYVDGWNRQVGAQLSLMFDTELSLRLITPSLQEVEIVDRYDKGGVAEKTRNVSEGELPVHTLVPEEIKLEELPRSFRKDLGRLLSASQVDALIEDGRFRYRVALKDYGVVVPFDYEGGCWKRPLPFRVAICGELSQLAAREVEGRSNGRSYLRLATKLLNPLSETFYKIGYVKNLWRKRVRAGLAISAIPGVAKHLRMYCDNQRFTGGTGGFLRNKGRNRLMYVQIAPNAEDCLGSVEVPAVLLFV